MHCILGGTFDPVHFGHLRPALEVQQALALERVHLLPARLPPHRASPRLGPEQRLTLLQLAVADEPALAVDTRELDREGPSYMVDTLLSLRAGAGGEPLCLALGMDALHGLDRWHRFEEIVGLCHLVVMLRPGSRWPESGVVAELVKGTRVETVGELRRRAAGCVLAVPVTQLAVSSTQIRALFAAGKNPRYLLPDAVIDRIMQEKWYAN